MSAGPESSKTKDSSIQRQAEVQVHSALDPQTLQKIHLKPCPNISLTIHQRLQQLGTNARIAALPQGPLTIPYIQPNSN